MTRTARTAWLHMASGRSGLTDGGTDGGTCHVHHRFLYAMSDGGDGGTYTVGGLSQNLTLILATLNSAKAPSFPEYEPKHGNERAPMVACTPPYTIGLYMPEPMVALLMVVGLLRAAHACSSARLADMKAAR